MGLISWPRLVTSSAHSGYQLIGLSLVNSRKEINTSVSFGLLKWWKINFSRWKKLFLPIPRQLAIRTGSGWGTGFHVPSRLLVQKWKCLWPWEMKKKLSGPWKVYYSFKHIQTLWRSEPSKGNFLKPKKVFLFLTTSNLTRNHPRLPRQFLKYTLQQVEAQVSMCLLGKHQPCRARAHETKREPGAYSWLCTHRSTDHTHFWSKREDAFGPGKWKKN